jgi:hypothetical protein
MTLDDRSDSYVACLSGSDCPSPSRREEYLEKFQACRDKAHQARTPEDEAAWLSMAEDWLQLAAK